MRNIAIALIFKSFFLVYSVFKTGLSVQRKIMKIRNLNNSHFKVYSFIYIHYEYSNLGISLKHLKEREWGNV